MSLATDLQDRYGTVLIRDHYLTGPDGTEYVGVSGLIRVVSAEDALGFPVSSRDSNWLVKVTGQDAGDVCILPGCAVLAFRFHDLDESYYGDRYLII